MMRIAKSVAGLWLRMQELLVLQASWICTARLMVIRNDAIVHSLVHRVVYIISSPVKSWSGYAGLAEVDFVGFSSIVAFFLF